MTSAADYYLLFEKCCTTAGTAGTCFMIILCQCFQSLLRSLCGCGFLCFMFYKNEIWRGMGGNKAPLRAILKLVMKNLKKEKNSNPTKFLKRKKNRNEPTTYNLIQ